MARETLKDYLISKGHAGVDHISYKVDVTGGEPGVAGGAPSTPEGLGKEPNTEIEIHIPILQFVLDVEKGIFGRGVIPDFKITQTIKEHLNGIDAEMEFTKSKID